MVTDAVFSALAGRPLWWRCMAMRPLDREWSNREDGEKVREAGRGIASGRGQPGEGEKVWEAAWGRV